MLDLLGDSPTITGLTAGIVSDTTCNVSFVEVAVRHRTLTCFGIKLLSCPSSANATLNLTHLS